MYYNLKLFGKYFKEIMKTQGYNDEILYEATGVSVNVIKDIKKGERYVTFDTLNRLSYQMNINLIELLLSCKTEEEVSFHRILNCFKTDVIKNIQVNLDRYLLELDSFYDTIKYDGSDRAKDFFRCLQKAEKWIKGYRYSVSDDSYEKAEDLYMEAIMGSHPYFSIEDPVVTRFDELDLQLLHSIVANRFRHDEIQYCENLLLCLNEKLRLNPVKDMRLHEVVLYSLSNLYLEQCEFKKSLEVMDTYRHELQVKGANALEIPIRLNENICRYKLEIWMH